jgi:hypothetical protein
VALLIWLPIEWESGKPGIKWHDEWKLSDFDLPKTPATNTGTQTNNTESRPGHEHPLRDLVDMFDEVAAREGFGAGLGVCWG